MWYIVLMYYYCCVPVNVSANDAHKNGKIKHTHTRLHMQNNICSRV